MREASERSNGQDARRREGERDGERAGDEGERRGTKRREGMEERGFIEAAGKSSVIAL